MSLPNWIKVSTTLENDLSVNGGVSISRVEGVLWNGCLELKFQHSDSIRSAVEGILRV